MKTKLRKLLLWLLPRNQFGDNVFSFFRFIFIHRRLPTKKMVFNDYLYRMKVDGSLKDPVRVFCSDKELVKLFVTSVVGAKYNVPTYFVINSADDVPHAKFPDTCCIKPTQASGEVILRKNSSTLDYDLIKSWFDINYYDEGREFNYRDLKPKIIVEEIIQSKADDYKFFCFNGVVKMIQVDLDRHVNHTRALFNRDWKMLDFSLQRPLPDIAPEIPENASEMLKIVEKLAVFFEFVRIDLYSDGINCYLGEITSCHGNAGEVFSSYEAELVASKLIFQD